MCFSISGFYSIFDKGKDITSSSKNAMVYTALKTVNFVAILLGAIALSLWASALMNGVVSFLSFSRFTIALFGVGMICLAKVCLIAHNILIKKEEGFKNGIVSRIENYCDQLSNQINVKSKKICYLLENDKVFIKDMIKLLKQLSNNNVNSIIKGLKKFKRDYTKVKNSSGDIGSNFSPIKTQIAALIRQVAQKKVDGSS